MARDFMENMENSPRKCVCTFGIFSIWYIWHKLFSFVTDWKSAVMQKSYSDTSYFGKLMGDVGKREKNIRFG